VLFGGRICAEAIAAYDLFHVSHASSDQTVGQLTI